MATNRQMNVRIQDTYRNKLEALAVGEGVSVGRAIELLIEHTPMQPVSRTGFVLKQKNNRQAAQDLTGQSSMAVCA